MIVPPDSAAVWLMPETEVVVITGITGVIGGGVSDFLAQPGVKPRMNAAMIRLRMNCIFVVIGFSIRLIVPE